MTTTPFGADQYDLAATIKGELSSILLKVHTWCYQNPLCEDLEVESLYIGLVQAFNSVRALGAEEDDLMQARKADAEANYARMIKEQM